jgi:hypothetical protein
MPLSSARFIQLLVLSLDAVATTITAAFGVMRSTTTPFYHHQASSDSSGVDGDCVTSSSSPSSSPQRH